MQSSVSNSKESILIWDFPIRAFHWALVAAISWSWLSIEIFEDLQQHFWAGYTVLALLIFRIGWGFAGSFYARFKRLFFPPTEITNYIKSLAEQTPKRYAGHNPLGSLAVLTMLALLMTQVGTGLFSTDDYYYGPLAGLISSDTIDQLTSLHKLNVEFLQILIGIHITAILAYRIFKKEYLTASMFHGRKLRRAISEPTYEVKSNKFRLALLLLALSAAAVYIITTLLAAPVPVSNSYY